MPEFWSFDDKDNLTISRFEMKLFLEKNGFFKMKEGTDNYKIMRKSNYIVSEEGAVGAQDFILRFLEDGLHLEVWEKIASSPHRFFGDLSMMALKTEDFALENVARDGKDFCMLYFEDGIMIIKKDSIERVGFDHLKGKYIWRKHLIPCKYPKLSNEAGEFERFCSNVAGKDDEKFESLMSIIGYLIHTYKDRGNGKAVAIYDRESIDGLSQGGTGKSIIGKSLGYVRNVKEENGKDFDHKNRFKFQGINPDHHLVFMNDIEEATFDFKCIFNMVTDNMKTETKFGKAVDIDYKYSPKILITTNGILKGVGSSFRRRLVEFEASNYYHENFTPRDEFGKELFDDWDEDEWNKFYSFMVKCVQKFLSEGIKMTPAMSLENKKIVSETSEEFCDFMSRLEVNEIYNRNELWYIFQEENKDSSFIQKMGIRLFKKWVNIFAAHKRWIVNEKREGQLYLIKFSERPVVAYDRVKDLEVQCEHNEMWDGVVGLNKKQEDNTSPDWD